MARGRAVAIVLSDEERIELERRVRRRRSSHGAARRTQIVPLAADGLSNTATAETLGVLRLTVGTWRCRFAEKRLGGLDDEPRPGAPRKIGDDKIAGVVTQTLETVPENATHWSRRSTGPGRRRLGGDGAPHLGCLRIAAAPVRDLQTVERSTLRRQGARHRRPLSRPAAAGACSLRRREEARYRRSTGRNRCCPCGRVRRSGAPTTASTVARRRCSPPSTLRQDGHQQVYEAESGAGVPHLPRRGGKQRTCQLRWPWKIGQVFKVYSPTEEGYAMSKRRRFSGELKAKIALEAFVATGRFRRSPRSTRFIRTR